MRCFFLPIGYKPQPLPYLFRIFAMLVDRIDRQQRYRQRAHCRTFPQVNQQA